ncbi:MAG: helix-turn-helix domain-containing protein [Steroidobacteraceae bacterium]
MNARRKKSSPRASAPPLGAPRVARMVEDIIGCKWSLCVLDLVSRGVARPGAMQRSIEGLSTKVLNERLRKLLRYGLIERQVFAEVPPHVEYRLTPLGRRFEKVLDQIRSLERSL